MKTTPEPDTDYPPLARDALGNLLPIPDGAAAWRICRNTGGRPRTINGPDKQPARFPLDITVEQLTDLCGHDSYRVYALDDVGNVIDYVTTLDSNRAPRNAAGAVETVVLPSQRPASGEAAPAGSSDLRFALEAVAQIARTNGEALRAIAESQADWIKAVAMAKGLPRNVAIPPPAPLSLPPASDDSAEDDEDDGEPSAPTSGIDAFLSSVTPLLPALMAEWRGKPASATGDSAGPARGVAHLAQIQAQLDRTERAFLDLLLTDPEAGAAVAADFASRSVAEVVVLVRSKTPREPEPRFTPPTAPREAGLRDLEVEQVLRQRATAVIGILEPAERARLMQLAPKLWEQRSSAEVRELVQVLAPKSTQESAMWLRDHLDELEARFAS